LFHIPSLTIVIYGTLNKLKIEIEKCLMVII
jgi:hypothetical protein